jgi:hypothetical protein
LLVNVNFKYGRAEAPFVPARRTLTRQTTPSGGSA